MSGVDRLSKVNEFLSICNESPVKKIREPFETSSERTKRRYAAKANECLTLLLETICPGESDDLKDAMFLKCESSYTDYDSPECIKALIDSYLKAETPTVRLQILSILANHYSFKDINAKLPSVTQHKFYTARKHAKDFGVGAQVPVEKRSREKVDTAKLEHFLDFITSNQVIKDLPLGEKTLTLSTGEIIQTPYVIRCLAPATIVRQYSHLCIEENFEAIGKFYFSTRCQSTCLSMFIYALFFITALLCGQSVCPTVHYSRLLCKSTFSTLIKLCNSFDPSTFYETLIKLVYLP